MLVDDIVNTIIGLVETVPKETIVHKVLRYLLMIFESKVPVLEYRNDTVTMDEIHGVLNSY